MAKAPSATVRFRARIYGIWMLRYVDVPKGASATFEGRHVPVAGTVNGVAFRGTLVPRGDGCFRLSLNGAARKAAGGVDAGDEVLITLRRSAPHRMPPMHPELVAALAARPGGRLAFESWPPGRRRQILLWLNEVKSADARARRIARILERLGFGPATK